MTSAGGSRANRVIHRAAWALAIALAAFALIGGADGAFRGDLGTPATQQRNDTDSTKHLTHVTLATVQTAVAASRVNNVASAIASDPIEANAWPFGLVVLAIVASAVIIRRERPGASRAPPALIA